VTADPTFDIGQRTLRVVRFTSANPLQDEYDGDDEDTVTTTDLEEATVVSSDMTTKDGYYHQPVIDFDIPVRLVPSSTPGHSHLYIDTPTSGAAYFQLLRALVDCGYVQPGYADASERRGHSDVRLPWIKKEEQA